MVLAEIEILLVSATRGDGMEAEGFQHLDGNLVDRARLVQNLAKHRAKGDHNRQEAQRASD